MMALLKKLWMLLVDLLGFSDEPLLARCAHCGVHFVAGPDSFVETGIELMAPEDFELSGSTIVADEDLETVFGRMGIDAAAVKQLRTAAPGDHITTGAEPWCEFCLRTEFGGAGER